MHTNLLPKLARHHHPVPRVPGVSWDAPRL
eukprot:COSAG02_NODE_64636_length_260_cov_0.627329_1_plen_29_part_10